jgi:hypothetical protein
MDHRDACDSSAPVAHAGDAQAVVERTHVKLNGSGSDLADAPLSFEWTQVAGPAVVLQGVDTQLPTFDAPPVTAPVTLTFELRVNNGTLLSPASSVDIMVNPLDQAIALGGGGGCSQGRGGEGGAFSMGLALVGLAIVRSRSKQGHRAPT